MIGTGPGHDISGGRDEDILSLGGLLQILWKRLWIIGLVIAVVTGAAVGLTLSLTPTYESSVKILIGQKRGNTVPGTLGGDVQGLQQVTQTMAEAVTDRPVAERVIRQLKLHITPEEFFENMSAYQVADTQFVEVKYKDPSPQRAQQVAEAIGDVFSAQVSEISPNASAITAIVWEQAVVPKDPVSPNLMLNIMVALVLGAMLGVGLAFLLEHLDETFRSPEEMEQVSGTYTFGIIPTFGDSKSQKEASIVQSFLETRLHRAGSKAETNELAERLVTVLDPPSAAAEAYRTLRTNLLYAAFVDEPAKVIVLTSPGPGEGKSTTCANLGVVLAQAAKNVLIIDCDLRKPVMHKFFSLRNVYGIVEVLIEERQLQEVWTEPVEGLHVVTVGRVPPNPTELLSTRRFSELLARCREEFDYVLIDAPPVGLVSDPAILATQGDGVLLISDAQHTRKGSVRQAVRGLRAVDANILSTVLNNVDTPKTDYYFYGYQ